MRVILGGNLDTLGLDEYERERWRAAAGVASRATRIAAAEQGDEQNFAMRGTTKKRPAATMKSERKVPREAVLRI